MPRKGSTTARGYGTAHRALRRWWEPRVARGIVRCAQCGHPIRKGEAWDLGHDETNRTRYAGPQHAMIGARCRGNRSEGASKRGRVEPTAPAPLPDVPLEESEW